MAPVHALKYICARPKVTSIERTTSKSHAGNIRTLIINVTIDVGTVAAVATCVCCNSTALGPEETHAFINPLKPDMLIGRLMFLTTRVSTRT